MGAILTFSVREIRSTLPLNDSMFLLRMIRPVPYPEKRPEIAGGLNLHGSLVPIFSMRKLFGLPARSPRITDYLIITRAGQADVALWVDDTYVVRDADQVAIENSVSRTLPWSGGFSILPDGTVQIQDLEMFLTSGVSSGETSISQLVYQIIPDLCPAGISADEDSLDLHDEVSVLDTRAQSLAHPAEKPKEVSSLEVLTFQLVYREYAVELKYVRESVLSREITLVPGTPDHVIGVIPVRGEIVPLLDLRVLLTIPDTGLTDLNQVIVLSNGTMTFGILADQITGISLIPKNEIRIMPSDLTPRKPGYILGFVDASLLVIDAGELLADPGMIVGDSDE